MTHSLWLDHVIMDELLDATDEPTEADLHDERQLRLAWAIMAMMGPADDVTIDDEALEF